jgi:hypothetical protein
VLLGIIIIIKNNNNTPDTDVASDVMTSQRLWRRFAAAVGRWAPCPAASLVARRSAPVAGTAPERVEKGFFFTIIVTLFLEG